MKFSVKVFLYTLMVVAIAFSIGGYFLISRNFDSAMDREIGRGSEEYQLLKFTLQSGILNASLRGEITADILTAICKQTVQAAPSDNLIAIHDENQNLLFSNFPPEYTFIYLPTLEKGEFGSVLEEISGKPRLVNSGYFEQNGISLFLSTGRNITSLIEEREQQTREFLVIDMIVIGISAVIMLLISYFLTRPIKRLTRVSLRIADGNYSNRARFHSHDEIGILADSFNRMAQTIQDKIQELELSAQQKEDFVANFAHELKTPLTSVIGYADMLSKKEHDQETVVMASSYILSEGKRLEALSLKLMDLIVLGKQDFVFQRIRGDVLLKNIAGTLVPLMAEKQIVLKTVAQKGYFLGEGDLLKTLIMNLIDNAVKAGSSAVFLSGQIEKGNYVVTVADNGRGIPKEELSRITEAFYMVDKSRSRAQHGAGLGLSIASKIAELHHTVLQYESEVGVGTAVRFVLPLEREKRKKL